jgi:hypothetical protein
MHRESILIGFSKRLKTEAPPMELSRAQQPMQRVTLHNRPCPCIAAFGLFGGQVTCSKSTCSHFMDFRYPDG